MLRSSLRQLIRSALVPALCVAGIGSLAQAQGTTAFVCRDDGRQWLYRDAPVGGVTLTLSPLPYSDHTFDVLVYSSGGALIATYHFTPGVTPPVVVPAGHRALIKDPVDANPRHAFGHMTIT